MSVTPPPDPAYAHQRPAYPPPQQHYPVAPPSATPYAPYPSRAPQPSAATAIIAGILAILMGVFQVFVAMIYVFTMSVASSVANDLGVDEIDWLNSFLLIMLIGSVVSAVVLLVGAVLLLTRKPFARWLVAVGSVVTAVFLAMPLLITEFFLSAVSSQQVREDGWSLFNGSGGPLLMVVLILSIGVPLVTTVLAFLPSTRRYCVTR